MWPAGIAIARATDSSAAASAYDFFGAHQAGITTPVQDHLHFAAFDMMARTDRADLISLLQDWSYAAARMTRGLEVSATGAVGGSPEAPPDDTGEALGLGASGLTITFGFGPTLFEQRRCGPLRHRRPPARRRSSGCRRSSATTSIRTRPAATCASRRAPTTRRSPCTPSAT